MSNDAEDKKLYDNVGRQPATSIPVEQTVREKPTETVPLQNPKTPQDYETQDVHFIAFKNEHPDVTYAQYRMEPIARTVREGSSHATLGTNLVDAAGNKVEFWAAGAAVAKKFFKNAKVAPDYRVVEYGCGSLRVGAHFIKYLEPEKFYGVDVVDGFYEIGKTLIGEALLNEKRPQFDVISDAAVENLARFSADFIYSSSVCYHVHPDEIAFYFAALEKITAKPGAILMFDVKLTDKPTRYLSHSWAWPLEFIKNALPGLEFVEAIKPREIDRGGHIVSFSVLKFCRPS
jgi:SAM-dependent methyltransferase